MKRFSFNIVHKDQIKMLMTVSERAIKRILIKLIFKVI